MKTELLNHRILLAAVVICGLLASLTLTSSETHAFDLSGNSNSAAQGLIKTGPDSVPVVTQEQAERIKLPVTKVSTLGCCDCVGQVASLDVSTGQGGGSTDPFWQVNNGLAYITPPVAGAWPTSPSANWIQPVASPLPSRNVPPGVYKYTLKFNVAKCTIPKSGYQLFGKFAADNNAIVRLDGGQIFQCTNCFGTLIPLNLVLSISPGPHTLEFEVTNTSIYSGLLVNAQIKGQCAR